MKKVVLYWPLLGLFLTGFMGLQPVDNSKFIEKKTLVYTGNTFVGKLKFAVNSANGPVVQVSKIVEYDPAATVKVIAPKDCPEGYTVSDVTPPKGWTSQYGSNVYIAGYPAGAEITCTKQDTPQIHQIEIQKEDIPGVVAALRHFEKELNFVQRAVIEEEK